MPWAELFMWIFHWIGPLILLGLIVTFIVAEPRKTNKHADRYWRD